RRHGLRPLPPAGRLGVGRRRRARPRRDPPRPRLLAAPRPPVTARRLARPHRCHLWLPGPGAVPAPPAAPALSRRAWRLLLLAGLAAFLGEFDGATLPLALPAISSDFHASLGSLSNLGS